jgi:RNA-directed DNA polymerase
VLGSLNRFRSTRRNLKGNEAKSAVGRPWERTLLGFRLTRRDLRRCSSPEAVKRLKERGREITRRTRGRRRERVAQELRRYLRGWKAYVGYAEVRSLFKAWDAWMQRRLRCYVWQPWGPRGSKALRQRGVSRDLAWSTAKSAHGPWRLSRSPALAIALPGSYVDGLGVPRLYIKESSQPNRRGT